jgi:FKBP-type peptidyl-prolyl cis-trans isomerase (trigger factor)
MEEEARPVAVRRLERSLILDQLAHEEKVEVDEGSLQSEFGMTLNELQNQGLNLGDMRGGKRSQQQVAEAIAMESASRLITRRTLERIKAIATGEYKPEEAEAAEQPQKASAEEKPEAKKKARKPAPAKTTGTKPKSASKKTSSEQAETE